LAQNGIVERTSEGSVEGEILAQPRGTGGFGYDPLFWLPEFGMTMAEIDLVTKQRISHRGKALAAMMQSIRG
jgi:XTP/dITP diphosphohydrolase